MLTLITYPAGFGQPSLSPFCVKAMHLLNASGRAWKRQDTRDTRKMPQQKLPVLRTPEKLIHDSDNIRLYLEDLGADFQEGLSDIDRAATHSIIRMAEEHMYFLLVLDRWDRDEVWPIIRKSYFSEIPAILRRAVTGSIRKSALSGLRSQGLGRMPWNERMARFEQDLNAISARLGDNPFLFGQSPSLADYSVVPILAAMRATPVSTSLVQRIASDNMLCNYIDRFDQIQDSHEIQQAA